MYNQSDWHGFQDTYRRVVGFEFSTIPAENGSGFAIPYEIKTFPEKGRSVVATTQVEKGQKVWDASYSARFGREETFMEYLHALPFEAACDVIMWSYVLEADDCEDETYEDPSCYEVWCDLDEGSLMNTILEGEDEFLTIAACEHQSESMKNVTECKNDTTDTHSYAVRDLEPGTEVIVDYDTFHVDDELDWFDDLWDAAS